MTKPIEVPRDNPKNIGVCKDVEELVLDTIGKDPTEAWHTKDLTALAHSRLGKKYTGDLGNHVMHACDQFFANRLIKRVAPSVFQDTTGPDEEFSERASGFVPEGEPYAKRPKNYTACPTVPSARAKKIFNQELSDADSRIGCFLSCKTKFTGRQMFDMITENSDLNPVAIKVALRQRGLTI